MNDFPPINSQQMNTAVKAMDELAVRGLLQQLSGLNPFITRQPETGLVMMNVRDCFNSEFHLGEVVVTTAEVSLDNHRGWGMIMGDDADRAILLAILDALHLTDSDEMTSTVRQTLHNWYARGENLKNEEQQMAAATRVNFESMTPED